MDERDAAQVATKILFTDHVTFLAVERPKLTD